MPCIENTLCPHWALKTLLKKLLNLLNGPHVRQFRVGHVACLHSTLCSAARTCTSYIRAREYSFHTCTRMESYKEKQRSRQISVFLASALFSTYSTVINVTVTAERLTLNQISFVIFNFLFLTMLHFPNLLRRHLRCLEREYHDLVLVCFRVRCPRPRDTVSNSC